MFKNTFQSGFLSILYSIGWVPSPPLLRTALAGHAGIAHTRFSRPKGPVSMAV